MEPKEYKICEPARVASTTPALTKTPTYCEVRVMANDEPMLPFGDFQDLRICRRCGIAQPCQNFLARSRHKDGYVDTCVGCRRKPCACGCGQLTNGFISNSTRQPIEFISGHHSRLQNNKDAIRAGQKKGQLSGNYRKGDAWKKMASEIKKGPGNPWYRNSERMRGIAKLCCGEKNGNYGHSARHGKGQWFTDRKRRTIWLRSTWETRVAQWLDLQEWDWDYEPQRYSLKGKTYAPDFWINQLNCYWEIKGWFHERHQETIREFRELYPEIVVVVLTKAVLRMIFGRSFK